ncbi:SWIRM domain-containing protein [Gaertneriomyces semiglobifer]|nr:SWIRM domain-containing protein [Gaertneriomyces semiglobifer]
MDMEVDVDSSTREDQEGTVENTVTTETPTAGDVSVPETPAEPTSLKAGSGVEESTDAGGVDGSGMSVKIADIDPSQSSATKMLATQAQEIIIPSYAAWFNMSRINDIEKKSLPEFFNNKNKSKTPSVYKDYRDFMINTYRLNPGEYLTVTACRRNLAGDVCAIIRVHAFLEQWGLINYQVDPDSRPSNVGPAFTGHFRVTADTPRGLQPLHPGVPMLKNEPRQSVRPTAEGELDVGQPSTATSGPQGANLALSKNMYANGLAQAGKKHALETEEESSGSPPPKKAKHNCATCGVDCSRVRYHSSKTPTMEVCPNCYLEGRFPSTMFSGDFVKLEDTPLKQASEDDWTDQETLLLLEGIELFDEDWAKIADHVGTRTRDQCVMKFLQLPIEDPFVNTKQGDMGPLQYHRVPFSAADNPVLSLTAFLAGVVDPKVAQAAAKAAIEELERQDTTSMAVARTQIAKAREEIQKENQGPEADADASVSSEQNAGTVPASPQVKIRENSEQPTNSAMDAPATVPGNMDVDETPIAKAETAPNASESSVPSAESETKPTSAIQKAGATAIAAASAKAYHLGKVATSELQGLTMALIQQQMAKLQAKMAHFEELEALLENERKELEREKQRFFMDRLAFRKQVLTYQAKETARAAGGIQGPTSPVDVPKGHNFIQTGGVAEMAEVALESDEVPMREPDQFLISLG